jgi:hypothetical protein
MAVLPIDDKLIVADWILNTDSAFTEAILRSWMNDRLKAVVFAEDDGMHGWALYFYTRDGYLFVTYLEAGQGYLSRCRLDLELYAIENYKPLNGFRFQTERSPKAWERLWPGFKTKYTIMEKGIEDEGNN